SSPSSPSSPSSVADRSLAILHIDFAGSSRGPSPVRLAVATALSIGLSLLADALLVVAATHLYPSTKGYGHFRFGDYGKLTVIGIVIAAAAWPVVVRVCTAPRWLFLRLAALVTLVLLLPDVYILHQGQPVRAVLFLMLMHLAIGVITYNALVRVAPPRRR